MANRFTLFDTDLGRCGLAWSEAGLTRVQLPEASDDAAEARLARRAEHSNAPPSAVASAIERLRRYFAGTPDDFADIALDETIAPDFEISIYRSLRQVPYGRTTTYGDLAKTVGRPGAARAVGMAMGRNPWPVVVPCHRVLASGRALGGFSAFGGTVTKLKLLRLEGAQVPEQLALPGLDDRA